jgi:hypothetical protein
MVVQALVEDSMAEAAEATAAKSGSDNRSNSPAGVERNNFNPGGFFMRSIHKNHKFVYSVISGSDELTPG